MSQHPHLRPAQSLSLSAACLWILPRLVARSHITHIEAAALKSRLITGDAATMAPIELFIASGKFEDSSAVAAMCEDLKAIAQHLSTVSSGAVDIVQAPMTPQGTVLLPAVPSAASLSDLTLGMAMPSPAVTSRSMSGTQLMGYTEGSGAGSGAGAGTGAGAGAGGGIAFPDSTADVGLTLDPAAAAPPSSSTQPSSFLSAAATPVSTTGSLRTASSPVRVPTAATEGSHLRTVTGVGKTTSVLMRHDVVLLYYAEEMHETATEIEALARGRVVLHSISWDYFPDGFPNLFIKNVKDVRFHSVCFLANLSDVSKVFEQVSLVHALARYGPKAFQVVVPYYPTGTHERITRMGEVATAATLARLLSITPPSSTGPASLTLLDIHALAELFYFSDQIQVRLKSCISLLKRRLKMLPDKELLTIAWPDEGAFKRFHAKFPMYPTVVCEKRRDGGTRRVSIKEGDCAGRHVVIVDDLVQSGGTLLACAQAVLKAGAARVSAYVTHAVFPQESWRKFVLRDGEPAAITKFWVTDSLPSARQLTGVPPFEVLSIAPVVLSTLAHV